MAMAELKLIVVDPLGDDYEPPRSWLFENPEHEQAVAERRAAFRIVTDKEDRPCASN